MAAKGCPVFVVEFNNYNIIADESISAKDHLVVIWQPKATQDFFVEFDNYNIIGDESISLISLLHGAS